MLQNVVAINWLEACQRSSHSAEPSVDLAPGWRWLVIGSCGSSAVQHTAPWCPASATCQVHGDGNMHGESTVVLINDLVVPAVLHSLLWVR